MRARSKGVEERREADKRPEISFAWYLMDSRGLRSSVIIRASNMVGGFALIPEGSRRPVVPSSPPVGVGWSPPDVSVAGGTTNSTPFFDCMQPTVSTNRTCR